MATVTKETKQSKILELSNLISQYDNGERENINISEYPQWQLISGMLKCAEIEESIYSDFLENPAHYKVVDGCIVYNENWEDEAATSEQERIAKLHITKLDFFKHICKPNNITYEQLTQMINANDDLAATWNLCSYIYRGDVTLNDYVFKSIPGLTEDALTEIFEKYAVNEI